MRAALKGSIYKKLEKSMKTLTIRFGKLADGKQRGYMVVILELGESVVMADSMEEVFQQLPEVIAECERNGIGIFGSINRNVMEAIGD